MKQYLTLFTVLLLAAGAKAQQANSISLNLYGGYTFKDKVSFDASYAYVDDAFQYGGGVECFLKRNQSVELKYLRMDTHLPFYLGNGTQLNKDTSKGSVQYILADYTYYFGISTAKLAPYLGAGAGVGILSMKDGKSATKFAWNAKAGVKIKTASAVSVNLQAYIQSITAAVGEDYWFTGTGYVVAVPDYATLFQFGLGAVLSFNFSKHK